jgi:hypothetical protein
VEEELAALVLAGPHGLRVQVRGQVTLELLPPILWELEPHRAVPHRSARPQAGDAPVVEDRFPWESDAHGKQDHRHYDYQEHHFEDSVISVLCICTIAFPAGDRDAAEAS